MTEQKLVGGAAASAVTERDAARWRWARKRLCWAKSWDHEVKWVMFLSMPEPDTSSETLTDESVALELDAAIDAEIALAAAPLSHTAVPDEQAPQT